MEENKGISHIVDLYLGPKQEEFMKLPRGTVIEIYIQEDPKKGSWEKSAARQVFLARFVNSPETDMQFVEDSVIPKGTRLFQIVKVVERGVKFKAPVLRMDCQYSFPNTIFYYTVEDFSEGARRK